MKDTDDLIAKPLAVFEQAIAILRQRGEEYNQGTIKPEDYWIHGIFSLSTILHFKTLRFKSFLEKLEISNDLKGSIVGLDETTSKGLKDSILDLINYLTFTYVFIEDEQGKNEEDTKDV